MESLELLYNKLQFQQFAVQKHGIQKYYLVHGGFSMTKFLNLLQQASFYQLVHL